MQWKRPLNNVCVIASNHTDFKPLKRMNWWYLAVSLTKFIDCIIVFSCLEPPNANRWNRMMRISIIPFTGEKKIITNQIRMADFCTGLKAYTPYTTKITVSHHKMSLLFDEIFRLEILGNQIIFKLIHEVYCSNLSFSRYAFYCRSVFGMNIIMTLNFLSISFWWKLQRNAVP